MSLDMHVQSTHAIVHMQNSKTDGFFLLTSAEPVSKFGPRKVTVEDVGLDMHTHTSHTVYYLRFLVDSSIQTATQNAR